MQQIDPQLQERLKTVQMLASDVDGVLTDGGVFVFSDGSEFRRFDIKDGLGLKQVMRSGRAVALISSSSSTPVLQRATGLGITEVFLGTEDKLAKLYEICKRLDIELGQVCYIGDDLPDLEIIREVGVACAPADAHAAVLAEVQYVTQARGGYGAVREICDLILSAGTDNAA
jgi:3-deoxy-D-manno-octulosonate 8-phosphate phosphatase (KDO 8-P phosphatase)